MSNLIKSVYFNVYPSKACVIDSDKIVEEFIPNIYDEPKQAEPFEFPDMDDEGGEEPFEDGLSVISMSDVVSEEREKILQQIMEEQEEAMNAAKQKADALVAQAEQEADAIRETARSEGFAAGEAEGRMQAEQELAKRRQELEEEYDAHFQELMEQEENLEPAFAELVVSLVKKLTGVVCENKKDVILYLLGTSMKNLQRTKTLIVRVSKNDMSRVSSKKPTLKLLAKDAEEFDIIEDDSLSENQCIIETDHRIIDCSLDAQLQNLEEHVKMLAF